MRCGRCGNENAEGNRFCGMCGTSLVATAQDAAQSSGRAPAAPVPVQPVPVSPVPRPPVQAPLPGPVGFDSPTAERRPVAPRSFESKPFESKSSSGPVITGPSFLGLSTPGPATDRHAERDPLRPSSNLDYLLDDEEEPKRGWGKPILVLVALVLAVGFGYLHWKQGGFDWLNAGDKKPAAAQPAATTSQSGTDSGSVPATTQGAAPVADAGSGGTAPVTSGAAPSSAEPPAAQAPAPPGTSPGTLQATSQPAWQGTVQSTPTQSTPSQTTSSQAAPSQTAQSNPNLPASAAPQTVGSDAITPAPSEEPKAAARKPTAAKPAARPVDTVTEAQRYVYGRGVRQDCDQGVRMLKAAAQQSNAKAMISMGALYSTGTCTPRDLPTAYRWFALALHKDPDNQALQDDLQKLWSQMTQPERQLAIKLSQ